MADMLGNLRTTAALALRGPTQRPILWRGKCLCNGSLAEISRLSLCQADTHATNESQLVQAVRAPAKGPLLSRSSPTTQGRNPGWACTAVYRKPCLKRWLCCGKNSPSRERLM